jgi:hypothetical protein
VLLEVRQLAFKPPKCGQDRLGLVAPLGLDRSAVVAVFAPLVTRRASWRRAQPSRAVRSPALSDPLHTPGSASAWPSYTRRQSCRSGSSSPQATGRWHSGASKRPRTASPVTNLPRGGVCSWHCVKSQRSAWSLLLAAFSGCGGRSVRPETALTILGVNKSVGRAVFHLACRPTGGDLPDNASACRALASAPTLVTAPKPFLCPAMPWQVAISGRLGGRRISRKFFTCWTPQMATIGRLGIGRPSVLKAHLLPRRESE